MNYRHAFHAGNFADLVKHAAVTLIMDRLTAAAQPLLVVDSHAGAGAYDLEGELARKSKEAEAGIGRLMADKAAPAVFDALKAAVRKANPKGGLRFYPGSPVLVADRLRREDEYVGAELRPDDFETLGQTLTTSRGLARAVNTDGFQLVRSRAADRRNLFVLIDPPYEAPNDYARIVEAVTPLLVRKTPATTLIWLPLKDLETFDAFLRRLEAAGAGDVMVAEARLQRLTDPMRMNGCALVVLGAPEGLEADLKAAMDWVVATSGGPGGLAKLWRLAS